MNRVTLHIDFDSFYASCEQQVNPVLRGKPIGVTAEHGRTCIIASSREAKKFGIKAGSRTFEAKKACPKIIFVPAHFEKYYKVSKKLLNICKDYSPYVELFSIDEVFINMNQTLHLYPTLEYIARDIKRKVRERIGEIITVSIGVSHNKLLAKLASSINKPNGFGVIDKSNLDKIYSKASLTDVCGIGKRVETRLNKIGVYTLLQLREVSIETLAREFGPFYSQALLNIGMGVDETPVVPIEESPEAKSVGRNYCLPHNEYNPQKILETIYELCEEVAISLRKIHKKARTVGLSLRGSIDFNRQETIGRFINLEQDVFQVCKFLLFDKDQPINKDQPCSRLILNTINTKGYVRQISVWVSNLQDENYITSSLFDNPKREKVAQITDRINEKFGDHTIRNAALLYTEKLTTKPNGYTNR